jgi:hypothetical protein
LHVGLLWLRASGCRGIVLITDAFLLLEDDYITLIAASSCCSASQCSPRRVDLEKCLEGTGFTQGVPEYIIDSIALKFNNLPKSTDATAFPEGSPTHPSCWSAVYAMRSLVLSSHVDGCSSHGGATYLPMSNGVK